jgi:hypothetical protein
VLRAVYALVDPDDPSRIRYLGCTSVRLRRRLSQHVAAARQSRRATPVNLWIRGLLKDGRRPCIRPLAVALGAEAAAALERKLIARYRGADLLNVTVGGGMPSDEHRAAIGAALRGRRLDFATRWKMSRAHRDAWHGWRLRGDPIVNVYRTL